MNSIIFLELPCKGCNQKYEVKEIFIRKCMGKTLHFCKDCSILYDKEVKLFGEKQIALRYNINNDEISS